MYCTSKTRKLHVLIPPIDWYRYSLLLQGWYGSATWWQYSSQYFRTAIAGKKCCAPEPIVGVPGLENLDFVYVVIPSVVPIDRLIGDITIFTANVDDQSQFLKAIFFNYLHMIKRHTFCFSYLCLIKRYTFCVSIIISTLFLQVLSRNFMKNAQHMMCDAHGQCARGYEKTSQPCAGRRPVGGCRN